MNTTSTEGTAKAGEHFEQVEEARSRMRRGLQMCRGRDFQQGYVLLRAVAESPPSGLEPPGLFYSYLGFGLAAFESRYNDGVALCERGIEMEFYNPENHYNLARTYLLLGAKRKAVARIRAGLRVDPEYRPLLQMARELGVRQRPMLPFLGRSHLLNRFVGKIRHAFSGRGPSAGDP